jgi:hypothetical protein
VNRSQRRAQSRSGHRADGGGIDLPTVATDPGCAKSTHVPEVMGAAIAWDTGARFPLPQVMDCGCRILWIGHGMPPDDVKP